MFPETPTSNRKPDNTSLLRNQRRTEENDVSKHLVHERTELSQIKREETEIGAEKRVPQKDIFSDGVKTKRKEESGCLVK